MIEIMAHVDGCILPVRAQPGARKNGIVGEHGGTLKVAVTAAPERGKANNALLKMLADLLGLKRSQVELMAGESSRDKLLLVRGLSQTELQVRLASLLT